MNIDFEAMAVLEEESQNESLGGGVYGSVGASGAEGGERREGGKRGRRPGRKAQIDKQDMKAKLERSRQSARECRARKKLRYQYLEELVADRERSVLALRKELDKVLLQVEFGARPGQDAGRSGSRTPRDGDRQAGGE
ncbi:REPTOR-binding partner isoform X5 [Helicoverpa armigera]|uniref:REPTOR-binding partner isoform X5 n=1 Tax=Helicoverpa zea TaxID=7113 RepID=UPI001F56C965|nr:REPTOR-binding partner isoform X5 [Helicoverpa zea]XP_049697340.1 REPTOR-binding partner isoform X2 [Helicoverpa armigera]